MKLLTLFAAFFKIGLFTFGGGYGMIPLVRQEVLSRGWMDEAALVRFIGVCESTPGPIAVNMATFVGSGQAGLLGAACATLGVVLPALVIMLLIARAMRAFRDSPAVRAAMSGIRPVVAGMIAATGACVAIRCLLPGLAEGAFAPELRQVLIAAALVAAMLAWQRGLRRKFSPILLILFSAACGALIYGL